MLLLLLVGGCATAPPKNVDNVCSIFRGQARLVRRCARCAQGWGVPVPVLMAFVHQESRFVARAKPPRRKILGFIPGPRPSDAYGYSQALQSTWDEYKRSAGRYGADRDDFADAIDFVGWYNHQSWKRNGIGATMPIAFTSPTTRVTAATPAPPTATRLAARRGAQGWTRGSATRCSWQLPSGAGKAARLVQLVLIVTFLCHSRPNLSSLCHMLAATCACPANNSRNICHERAHRTGSRR
jgi:hypothetical protein